MIIIIPKVFKLLIQSHQKPLKKDYIVGLHVFTTKPRKKNCETKLLKPNNPEVPKPAAHLLARLTSM